MKPSLVLKLHRSAILKVVANHCTCNSRVFGSMRRGEDQDESDLDLLVDPLPGVTLFDLGAIQVELEEMLGVSVDVLTPGDLPARFRETIIREVIPV